MVIAVEGVCTCVVIGGDGVYSYCGILEFLILERSTPIGDNI